MDILLAILIILVIARLFGEIAKRLGQPAVIGELIAGVVLGPMVLNIIQPTDMLGTLAQIGIFFLMFLSGMEISGRKLLKTGYPASLTALGGVMLPLLLGFGCSIFIGLGYMESLIIGICMSITSVPVSVDALLDMKRLKTKIGYLIVEAGVIDDIMGLFFISTIVFATVGNSFGGPLLSITLSYIKIIGFFVIAIILGLYVVPKLLRMSERMMSKESIFAISVILLIVYGAMANVLGLSEIVGAFLAGIFVRRAVEKKIFERRELLDQFSALSLGFLTPLFFVWIGISVMFSMSSSFLGLVALFLVVAIAGKLLGSGWGAKAAGLSWRDSLAVGVGMNGRGAMELIIAEIARTAGLISPEMFSVVVMVALVTTIMTPPLLKRSLKK